VLNSSEQFLSLHYVAVPAQPWNALEREWLGRLAPARRARLLQLRHRPDRNASLLGVALLGLGCDRLAVPFVPGALDGLPRSRPSLPGGPSFSISHAGGLVACVCAAGGALGLDLEPRGAATAAGLRLALGPDERARIARGELEPTTAWVMVEAVLKAAGLGIDAAPRVRLGQDRASVDGAAFGLTPAPLGEGHVVFVAHEPGPARLEVLCHEASEFAPLP
jgi:phosphopantetheinyl transferase